MKPISIDLETYSDVDLQKCGVYKYAQSENFEILLFGYSVDGGEVIVIDLAQGEKIPKEIIKALTDESIIKWAFNASFERVCLSEYLRKHYEKAFSFTPNEYISIHKKLFAGIYGHAGKLRDYNITKKEWVLNGATVLYGSASELRATLDYDFAEEKKFSYKNLSMEEIIHHLAIFISRLWQIHVFGEGNTRTTAVFFIKYLRTLGFDVTNDIFAENAWYFRNALVRANYNDLKNGVHETTEYLELFLRNLLLDEKNELHNRSMHISGKFKETDFESAKVDIENAEEDIESQKADIRNKLLAFSDMISEKTINHTFELFSKCGKEEYFGRTIVEDITGLKSTRASELIKLLVDSKVIVSVTGHGKGKYRFQL